MKITNWNDLTSLEIDSIHAAFYVCFGTLAQSEDVLRSWYNIKFYIERDGKKYKVIGVREDKSLVILQEYDPSNNENITSSNDLAKVKQQEIDAAKVLGIYINTLGVTYPKTL